MLKIICYLKFKPNWSFYSFSGSPIWEPSCAAQGSDP